MSSSRLLDALGQLGVPLQHRPDRHLHLVLDDRAEGEDVLLDPLDLPLQVYRHDRSLCSLLLTLRVRPLRHAARDEYGTLTIPYPTAAEMARRIGLTCPAAVPQWAVGGLRAAGGVALRVHALRHGVGGVHDHWAYAGSSVKTLFEQAGGALPP